MKVRSSGSKTTNQLASAKTSKISTTRPILTARLCGNAVTSRDRKATAAATDSFGRKPALCGSSRWASVNRDACFHQEAPCTDDSRSFDSVGLHCEQEAEHIDGQFYKLKLRRDVGTPGTLAARRRAIALGS